MPTVVSSRALVPIGRRIPNAPEDSDASKAIVLRRKQAGEENEDLSKALIIRPSDDGKDDRQALVLYRKKGGPEALRELAEWHKSSTLLPPFRLEELLRVSESQFLSCLGVLQNLQSALYFHDDIVDTIKATREYAIFKEKGGDDPLQNQAFVTQTIASRIHNAYFRAAAWKYVRDHAKLLKDMELEDLNVYAQLKSKPALCVAYLETYEMLRQIEASGQHEVGLLASASPHYMKHFKENGGVLEWDSEAGQRLNKSLVDTIIIELILPQSRYPASILMLCLRDAIAGGDHKTAQRFTQDVFDAIGDLSVTLQLLDMMDTPISASDARAWRLAQSENINANFTALIKSSQAASSHVAGIGAHIIPLTKTKTPATLEKIWDSINQTYVARAGMDIDILWGLEDSMNPEPQWSAWALTRTKDAKDDEPDARALVRKGKGKGEGRRKKLLAIAAEANEDDLPDLIDDPEDSDEEEDSDSEGWSDDEEEEEDDDEREWHNRKFEEMRQQEGKTQAQAPAKSPEGRGNPFKTLFRSLKGRFLTKNPILSVDPEAPRAEFDERDEDQDQTGKKKKKKKPKKKTGGAAGDDEVLPSLLPAYPIKGIASDLPPLIPVSVAAERLKARNAAAAAGGEKVLVKKANVQLGEVDDEDTHKPETSGKKKKKKKKKSAKKAGEAAEDEDEEDEPPRPQTPVTPAASTSAKSPPPARSTPKSPQSSKAMPTSPTMGAASASAASLYMPQPETAQSGLSYMKSEGIGKKTKTKSRPEPSEGKLGKLGTFMSRTFWAPEEKAKEEKVKDDKGKGKGGKDEDEDAPPSGVAERLKAYMKSVTGMNSRVASSWERILGLDDTKGQSGLDWNAFVKAMTDLGFEYDESSAGSRVRFDPPNRNDKSYTTHKPHPDPWLHPKRVKHIARDLHKMYGFDADTLLGRSEATA